MVEAAILYTAARHAKNTALHPGFIHASKHTTFFLFLPVTTQTCKSTEDLPRLGCPATTLPQSQYLRTALTVGQPATSYQLTPLHSLRCPFYHVTVNGYVGGVAVGEDKPKPYDLGFQLHSYVNFIFIDSNKCTRDQM